MSDSNYRAIEVIPGKYCNCALSKHAAKRMLYSDILNLLESSQPTCSCTFKHYEDRRHISDRRKFDVDNLTSNPHGRTQPYGRQLLIYITGHETHFLKEEWKQHSQNLKKQDNLKNYRIAIALLLLNYFLSTSSLNNIIHSQ